MTDEQIQAAVQFLCEQIDGEADAILESDNDPEGDAGEISNAISEALFRRLAERIPVWVLTAELEDETTTTLFATEERALAAAAEEAELGGWETAGPGVWTNIETGGTLDVHEGRLQ